jgi:para-aminobenzoate synthetase/4-amino-4-deoxychorismate lyase
MNFDDIIKQVSDNPYSAFFYTPPFYKKSESFVLMNPKEIIPVYNRNDMEKAFRLVDKFTGKAMTGYCLIEYEAGYLLEKKLNNLLPGESRKLMQFIFFQKENVKIIKSEKIEFGNIVPGEYNISNFNLNASKEKFYSNIDKIRNFISEGDTYQVNYTVKGKFNFEGSYSQLFKSLLFNQSAKYPAFINYENHYLISISPELFFKWEKNKITAHPMKGTIRRSIDITSDSAKAFELERSEKNKAENVMIVDLLRNDLGRICKYGSVKVDSLFKIEKFESLYQMVSSISGKLNEKIKLGEIIKNIFPCGSVTGAPKIKTMEIIRELEEEDRGIYTGAIGLISKNFTEFNVAIRTLKIEKETGRGEMGLGSGIVWDSNADNEYNETMLKSEFLTKPLKPFELIETMLVENGEIYLFERHIERLRKSAEYFLFIFNEKENRKLLLKLVKKKFTSGRYKLRMTLNKLGKTNCDLSILDPDPDEINVMISENTISTKSVMQYFKTTNRDLYNGEFKRYSAEGFFDVLFFNEKKELAEGSFTNIIIKKDNEWLTPSVSCGILPGIFRSYLIQNNKVKESIISHDDLLQADEIKLVNSVRKEIKVNKIYYRNEFIEYP